MWRLALPCLLAVSVGCWAFETTVARPPQGAARGVRKTSLSGRPFWAFHNLPYAKPPVGPLRFKDPQPPDTWVHIRDATTPGAKCAQVDFMLGDLHPSGSEDCLYLNVFTPELSGSYPVMFWIHGGGWFCGSGKFYGPDYLLDHDVVLVTINYRLGPFGFLSTEDSIAPGNFGLKDQVAALKWVKENIAAFGGDPNSVTIFGESAGGASVNFHMLSSQSQGLFHRGISQSGTVLSKWAETDQDALGRAKTVGTLLGCPSDTSKVLIDCLRQVDEYDLAQLTTTFLKDSLIPFPVVVESEVENAFLPKQPLDLKPVPIPWISGVTKNEGAFVAAVLYQNKTLLAYYDKNFGEALSTSMPFPTNKHITEKVKQFYFSSEDISIERLTDIFSDYLFNWGTADAVRRHKDIAPVYNYVFAYRGKNTFAERFGSLDVDLGVSHIDDLFYLFPVDKLLPGAEMPKEELKIVKTMTRLWTDFAKTGNPTPGTENIKWIKVSSEDEAEYLEIGENLQMKKGLYQDRVNFWRSLSSTFSTSKDEL